jgi:N utilization substance protein B
VAAPFCVSWETMDNDGGEMKRRELREHIFQLLFRVEFNEKDEMAKQVGLFVEDMEEETEVKERDKTYISEKYAKIVEKLPEIDKMLDEVSKGWKTSRMGKVELTILRLAVYEMRFDEDIPQKVAINEAVELSKKFGGNEAPAFVNGVLAKLTGN